MESGALAKVVLARQVEVVANRPFVVPETLARLASLYPSCAVFHVDGFLGASPETLLRRTGNEIESHPLAGTVARSGDPASDEALVAALMSSSKDRHEHQLVVDKIVATLRPLCTTLDVPDAPSVVPLRNVSHLGTVNKGAICLPQVPARALALTGTSPTARARASSHAERAQLSLPASRSLPFCSRLPQWAAYRLAPRCAGNGITRDSIGVVTQAQWAGLTAAGDGEWVLGLRSASVSGRRATLYAGNGIVAGSDPDAELAETQLKLQALLAALVRP